MAKASQKQLSEFYKLYGGPNAEPLAEPIEEQPPQSEDLSQPVAEVPPEVDTAMGDVPVNEAEPEAEREPAKAAFQTGFEQGVKDQLSPQEKSAAEFQKKLEAILPDVTAQREGLKRMEALTKGGDKGDWRSWDLSPLLAYFDAERGTKLAQSYKSPEQRAAEKLGLESKVQDQREGVTKSMLDLYKQGKEASDQARQGRADRKLAIDITNAARKESAPIVKSYVDQEVMFNQLEDAYKSGDLKQIYSLAGTMAQAIGGNKGATSDNDAARQMMETIKIGLEKYKTKTGFSSQIPRSELQSYITLIEKARQRHGIAKQKTVKTLMEGFKPTAYEAGRADLVAPGGSVYNYFQGIASGAAEAAAEPEKVFTKEDLKAGAKEAGWSVDRYRSWLKEKRPEYIIKD